MNRMAARKVRVLVVDDHPLYREGVVRALVGSGLVEVVAEAENGEAALAEIRAHQPDVALVDQKLPDLNGIELADAAARDGLATRVLLLSAFTDSGIVHKAIEAGAAGYLPKEARRDQIVDSVLACARGETVVAPDLTSGLVSEIRMRAVNDAARALARSCVVPDER